VTWKVSSLAYATFQFVLPEETNERLFAAVFVIPEFGNSLQASISSNSPKIADCLLSRWSDGCDLPDRFGSSDFKSDSMLLEQGWLLAAATNAYNSDGAHSRLTWSMRLLCGRFLRSGTTSCGIEDDCVNYRAKQPKEGG
jgi:hypothetical protein